MQTSKNIGGVGDKGKSVYLPPSSQFKASEEKDKPNQRKKVFLILI